MSKDLEIMMENAGERGEITVIRPIGLIDANTAEQLHVCLCDVIGRNSYRIVVDLQNTTYISSAGWGIFISEIHRLTSNGGALKLAALTPEVEEVFDILEFHTILKSFATVEDAIRDFR